MRVRTFSILFLLMAIYMIFIDDYVRPRSKFSYLVIGTMLTGIASLMINLDIPS